MFKIYITGIAGLLGNNIARSLKDKCEISGCDIIDINIPSINYKKFSLLETEILEEHIKNESPDVLIHTAAAVNVDLCQENPQYAYKLNSELTKTISDLCNKYNIKMIYISTDAVFDGKNSDLYTEEDETNPINIYGRGKLLGEKYTLEYKNNLVLRTNIYGINIQNKNSFGEWIVSELEKGNQINMFEDIDFSPILVNELTDIIYLAINKKLCGIYHGCGTGCITKYDFGLKVQEVFNLYNGKVACSQSDKFDFKAPRSKHMGMSNEKLSKELNIHISTPEESIKKFYELYYKNME